MKQNTWYEDNLVPANPQTGTHIIKTQTFERRWRLTCDEHIKFSPVYETEAEADELLLTPSVWCKTCKKSIS